jgi:hypothetical protein
LSSRVKRINRTDESEILELKFSFTKAAKSLNVMSGKGDGGGAADTRGRKARNMASRPVEEVATATRRVTQKSTIHKIQLLCSTQVRLASSIYNLEYSVAYLTHFFNALFFFFFFP